MKASWALLALSLAALLVPIGCGGAPDVEIHKRAGGPEVEWGKPSGTPRGVVMLLPGGGWQRSRPEFEQQRANAAKLRGEGYATVVIGYDAGAKGFHEIEDVYTQVRRRYRHLPICASGVSAGGHLSLMLAAREPSLACVVDIAGPTDLTSLTAQGATVGRRLAIKAFGEENLAKYSPVRYANRIKAKVLMVLARTDPVNPVEQGFELKRALPGASLDVLPPGGAPVALFHFGRVSPAAVQAATQRILNFLANATGSS